MEGGRSWFCAVCLLSQGSSVPSGFRHLTGSGNCVVAGGASGFVLPNSPNGVQSLPFK
jgi:hypothetical protein